MRRTITLFMLVALVSVSAFAQKPLPSPPAKTESTIDGISVVIDYHQPSAKGRKVMGALVPYGEVWRTGANGTTSIEFGSDVKVEGKAVPKGKYGLFTIPGETEWTIIINKTIKWGAMSYNEGDDLVRLNVKAGKTPNFVETFSIAMEGSNVVLRWENTRVAFKVSK